MGRFDAKGVVVMVLLVVVVIGAVAEVVAGRTAPQPGEPRAASWQILIQSGDAARVRGDAAPARRAYLNALFQARSEGSTRGVLRAAEGFKALGEAEAVEHALGIAAALGPEASRDGAARLQALRDRLDASDALPLHVPIAR
jgi:hypothetical protein